jgi:peptide/nickel transport system permease protein
VAGFIIKRLLMGVLVLLGISFIVFALLFLSPQDAAETILGNMATEEDKEMFREQNGLNDPFIVQYSRYIKKVALKGDLGVSYATKQPVSKEIFQRFSTTFRLAGFSIILAAFLGVTLGLLAAMKQNTWFDHTCTFFSVMGVSIPNFWQGMMMIILFSVVLKWLPPSGLGTPLHWIMPVITLGTAAAANIMRMTRSSVLEVIRQDYIRTAHAKGLAERVVVGIHVLKSALIPVVTIIGYTFGRLMGGAVMTESIFSIPGLGKLMVDAIKVKNIPLVQGSVLYIAFVLVLLNIVIDVLYAFIDPRIRSQYEGTAVKKTGVSQEIRTGEVS